MNNGNLNIKEIASQLELSPTTVSRVINGKAEQYRISKVTEKKVLDFLKQHDFAPNQIARGLRLKKTNTIGLVIPDISNPFFSTIARIIENECRKKGYAMILVDSQEDGKIEVEAINQLYSRKVDGIIIAPVGIDSKHIEDLVVKNYPLVLFDRYFEKKEFSAVSSDNYNGAYEGVQFLIDSGHRKIACIQGLPNSIVNTERIKGFKDCLEKNEIKETIIQGNDFGEKNGYENTKKLLKNTNRPTAIFAMSNLISLGAMRAIFEEGLRIPNDVSLISFDEQPYSAFLSTPMTTIEQNKKEIGKKTVKLMFNKLKKLEENKSKPLLIPTRLIKRKSVKIL